ncbi:MAG: adenylate/guanylate cyclase domain-containing protein, partial [Actinomycetota bacterium]
MGRRFCSNCGASLALACPKCGSPNEVDERFCGQCGARLDGASGANVAEAEAAAVEAPVPSPPEEERRLVTVLFADLAGFTSMSEGMDPEAVKALAGHCADLMSAEVRRFGGTVSSVMGDAIMAMFGAPVSHEDDPERAVRAAVAMREVISAVEGAPKKLQLHVGINTGQTMAGLIGPDEARDYTAMGDTTNTAARLMGAAPSGSIYMGKETYLATRHAVESRPADPVMAKGKAEPVPVWEVVEVAPVPTERPVGATPLVGRDAELTELLDMWTAVRHQRRPARALVLGPPGIGKTRLLGEFVERTTTAAGVLRGRCLPYGEGITYWPIIEMVMGSAGILHDDDEAATSAKLGRFVEGLPTTDRDELQTIATALSSLMAVPATPKGTYRAATITRGELHWGIRRLFELKASGSPLVLLFEDLHWAEPTLLELLDVVTDDATGAILVLGSGRPELADAWSSARANGNRRLILLDALSTEESESLIATLLPVGVSGRGPLDAVLRSAAGNPLFLEEMVGMLTDAGLLDERGLHMEKGVPVPGSIQGLIGSRLDLLPDDDRRVAQLSSVVGFVFWSGLVSDLRGSDDVLDALGRLEARDLVRAHLESSIADEREFAFKHALIRDVAYSRLPKKRRSELHARCADWVSRLSGTDDELIEIVAYHLESSCTLARELGPEAPAESRWRAADALSRAAEKAERREGTAEADRFFARALDLVGDEQDQAVTELRLRRSRTLIALGQSKEATEILRRVADEAVSFGRLDLQGRALVGLANVAQKLGHATQARGHVSEAAAIADAIADAWLKVRTAYESAAIRADFEGEVDGAVGDLSSGLETADELGDLSLRIEGHLRIGTILATAGKLREAEDHLERCARLAEQTGSLRDDARAAYLLAYVRNYLGRPEDAEPLAARAAEWLERTGDRYFQIQNLLLLGRLALTRGELDEAARRIREAVPLAVDVGGWLLVETNRYLVEVLLLDGELDAAWGAASVAAEAVPEEDAFARAESLLSAALISAAEGDESATAKMDDALELLAE